MLLKTFNLFGFPVFWLEAHPLKVIPDKRRAH